MYGLWLGFSIACIILDIGFCCIIECPDWARIAREMQKKIDKERVAKIQDSIRLGKRVPDEDFAGSVAATPEAKKFVRMETNDLTNRSAKKGME